jgi:endoglucanase
MLLQNLFAVTALVSSAFAAPAAEKRQSKLQWFGVNESGAEFGEKNFTGVYGKEFTWYSLDTIDQFIDQGMNMFRLNLCRETSHPKLLYILLTR